jgi:hypothetical protein
MRERNGEIFVSVDVEATGPLVGINSMISLGSVAFRVGSHGYEQLSTFEENLQEYPESIWDPEVTEWWKRFPEALRKARTDAKPPEEVMQRYLEWLRSQPGTISFLAYPATYDFMYVFWYLKRFTGEQPFGVAGLCSRSYATGMLGLSSWANYSKKDIPERFKSAHPHDHTPLNDAIQQGEEFAAMYYENVIIRNGT